MTITQWKTPLVFLPILLAAPAMLLAAQSPPEDSHSEEAVKNAYVHNGPDLRTPGSVDALSAGRAGAPEAIARDLLSARASELGLVAGDLDGLEVSSIVASRHTGVRHVYLQQVRDGIPVFGGVANVNVAADGRVLSLGNRLLPNLASAADRSTPTLEPAAAVDVALGHLGREGEVSLRESKGDARRHATFHSSIEGAAADGLIATRLTWLPVAVADVRLTWEVEVEAPETSNAWHLFVDAHTGELLHQVDLVIHDDFGPNPGGALGGERSSERDSSDPVKPTAVVQSEAELDAQATPGDGRAKLGGFGDGSQYEVFAMPAEYPYEDNDPTTASDDVDPADPDGGRSVEAAPADATASPFGWHDTDGVAGAELTITSGNNVDAYLDRTNSNSPDPGSQPDGGASLDFTGALVPLDLINDGPNAYGPASVVNLFYWNNIIHDVFYRYGFDEASGNFQVNNYGNGGAGNDPVDAEAQDGSGTNNANFFTPTDGQRPRMQMYTWTTTTPGRDGDFSSMIITHEYGHGISNRLTGGPNNVFCLDNSEQMGEGWSDWLGLVLTANAGDSGATQRGVGTYALGEPPDTGGGIRPAPYTTDFALNDFTYGNTTGGLAVPHGIGFDWATITWEVYWALVDEHGFNPNFYDDWSTGGNNLAIQLVMDGMKLQPCSPGFVDGRDAILQADQNLTGGANQCLMWEAFARRGLGASASQGSSGSNSDNVEAFDIPASCELLAAAPPSVSVCAGADAVYDLQIGDGFTPPVTLSALGNPAGTSAAFSPNPVMTTPGSSELTLSGTGSLVNGSYDFDVRAADASQSFDLSVDLSVFDAAPGAVTLTAPVDGADGQSVNPLLEWTAAPGGGTYSVEIATDAAFSDIVDSASGLTSTSYTVTTSLDSATTYSWRVATENPCGTEPFGAASTFTTAVEPGDCEIGISVLETYAEDFEAGEGGWTHSAGVGSDTWGLVSDEVHSGTSAFHGDDVPSVSDQYLVSPALAVPSSGSPITLRFWNRQELEDSGSGCYDGGVLEISDDGGATWTRLEAELLTDPYDGPVSGGFSNPIAGSNAWCGDPQEWLESAVDIGAWAGQTVRVRFRLATDSSVAHPGWWIDDVSIQTCVDGGLFEDAFESGDTSAWATAAP